MRLCLLYLLLQMFATPPEIRDGVDKFLHVEYWQFVQIVSDGTVFYQILTEISRF